MDEWFGRINTECGLSTNALGRLQEDGFVVIPGPFESGELARVSATYDDVVLSALSDDIHIGSSTTRVNGFADPERGFAGLYTHQLLLEASSTIVGKPFKLSSMHARTLHPNSQKQRLHIDFKPNEDRFPLAGFIFMVDEFDEDNGATRFVPGSHKWPITPDEITDDSFTDHESKTETARGPAGSLIVFDGSVWHGHRANLTNEPRRSIQGAFVPRDAQSGFDFKSSFHPNSFSRITPLAKYLLAF